MILHEKLVVFSLKLCYNNSEERSLGDFKMRKGKHNKIQIKASTLTEFGKKIISKGEKDLKSGKVKVVAFNELTRMIKNA